MNANTGSIAAVEVKESVSISKASTPKELFAFVINGVVVVSDEVTITPSSRISKVTSFSFCEQKIQLISR